MSLTNKYNVPDPVVRALDWHTHRKAFLSASETSLSPRQFWLKERHKGEVVEDVSERIWALLGTAVHYILEKAAGKKDLTEEYLEAEVAGETVSGITDLYKDGKISDYKVTSVWKYIYKDQDGLEDYVNQLNTDAYLYRKAGFEVNELEIVMILRDWQKRDTVKEGYPEVQIQTVPIELWDEKKQHEFLSDQIGLLKCCAGTPDDELPECTEAERWFSGEKFAIHKIVKGKPNKRALKLFDSREDAEKYQLSLDHESVIEHRPGESKRCPYCVGRDFCSFYLHEVK